MNCGPPMFEVVRLGAVPQAWIWLFFGSSIHATNPYAVDHENSESDGEILEYIQQGTLQEMRISRHPIEARGVRYMSCSRLEYLSWLEENFEIHKMCCIIYTDEYT